MTADFSCSYYDLVTDLYESGWGKSFHLCRFLRGEAFFQAQARHEHYLASMLKLEPGMKILDVGCGVGGPARETAAFTDCHVVGLNNNAYQIERARKHTRDAGLEHHVEFVKGDFMVCMRKHLLEHLFPNPIDLVVEQT